ncbi:conserved hypothetical protein [Histoplasma capsulatum H143]|uniref:Uncharacterized protein n=1 Tax=Ajellomyces capsulatus (strain H143) TaxID=544712 RepID=C6HBJ5_AJECH|nr:conserved hypothetical protein [Histoplasma capsulatum H143]
MADKMYRFLARTNKALLWLTYFQSQLLSSNRPMADLPLHEHELCHIRSSTAQPKLVTSQWEQKRREVRQDMVNAVLCWLASFPEPT